MSAVLSVVLPIVVAAVAMVVGEKMQEVWKWMDKWPAWGKQVAIGVLAFGLTKAAGAGIALTSLDPTQLINQDYSALISAGLAYVFHLGAQAKANA